MHPGLYVVLVQKTWQPRQWHKPWSQPGCARKDIKLNLHLMKTMKPVSMRAKAFHKKCCFCSKRDRRAYTRGRRQRLCNVKRGVVVHGSERAGRKASEFSLGNAAASRSSHHDNESPPHMHVRCFDDEGDDGAEGEPPGHGKKRGFAPTLRADPSKANPTSSHHHAGGCQPTGNSQAHKGANHRTHTGSADRSQ
jgi:hypothetical protein